jgi:hypothetical protein
MSLIDFSVYGRSSQGTEGRMDIERRSFLGATFCLALSGSLGQFGVGTLAQADELHDVSGWHSLTRSLLDRARNVNSADARANASRVERVIHDTAFARGYAKSPVIKWLADPFSAFGYLSRYGLDALLGIGSASFWRRAEPSLPFDDRSLESSLALGRVVADIIRPGDHDQALMAPKLLAKRQAMAGNAATAARFEIRAVAAQIGWLETCLPVDAAQAIANVELFLCSGFAERDQPVQQQLRVFEAYELGLLATWETPTAIICVPRSIAV